jgi:Family of unknown function (DUF5681)
MSWAPGQSGNPSGRPKGTGYLQKILRRVTRHRGDFVKALVDGLKDEDAKVRAKCIELGMAYCFGPPGEAPPADALPPYSHEPMTPDELAEAEAMMSKPPLKQ